MERVGRTAVRPLDRPRRQAGPRPRADETGREAPAGSRDGWPLPRAVRKTSRRIGGGRMLLWSGTARDAIIRMRHRTDAALSRHRTAARAARPQPLDFGVAMTRYDLLQPLLPALLVLGSLA